MDALYCGWDRISVGIGNDPVLDPSLHCLSASERRENSCRSLFLTLFPAPDSYNDAEAVISMTVIYIENVFLINWAIDYFLLLAAAGFAGSPLRRLRFALCAAAGGLYAVAVFLPGCTFLSYPVWKILAGGLMALAAYWPVQRCWRLMALFFMLSGALAGIVLAIALACGTREPLLGSVYYAPISWPILLSTTVILYFLLHFVFRQGARHGGGELMTVTVSIHQRSKQVLALQDNGNTLRDPVNGHAVLVLERTVLEDLWPTEVASILQSCLPPEEKMAQLYQEGAGTAFTLLPFRSVGVASGLLLAVRSDYIKVGKATYPRALIALSDGPVSDGGTYQALWGGTERRSVSDEAATVHSELDPQTQQAG